MVSCKSAASAEREWRRKFSIYRLELCAVYCIRHMRYKTRQHQANIMVAFDDDELAWAATAAALRSSVCMSRLRPPRRVTLAMAGHRLWPAFHLIYCYVRRVWQTRGSQQSTKKKKHRIKAHQCYYCIIWNHVVHATVIVAHSSFAAIIIYYCS